MKHITKTFLTLMMCMGAFSQSFAQQQAIRVFSHRGGRMEHDENTMQAFAASRDAGYRGYETDVRMTADSAFVITHDSHLDRTTNGTGAVEHRTEAELRALETKGGNKLLFLPELVEFLQGQDNLYVEFEMKTQPVELYPDSLLEYYCDALYKATMPYKPADATFLYTSGDHRALRTMQRLHPDAPLLMITGLPVCRESIDMCKSLGIARLGATMPGTSRKAVEEAHAEGLIVSLWPGQSVADFMLGSYLGADFLCTDVPLQIMNFQKTKAPYLPAIY